MKKEGFSGKRIEEAARTQDVISRAKAASPIQGGADRLDTPSRIPGLSGKTVL